MTLVELEEPVELQAVASDVGRPGAGVVIRASHKGQKALPAETADEVEKPWPVLGDCLEQRPVEAEAKGNAAPLMQAKDVAVTLRDLGDSMKAVIAEGGGGVMDEADADDSRRGFGSHGERLRSVDARPEPDLLDDPHRAPLRSHPETFVGIEPALLRRIRSMPRAARRPLSQPRGTILPRR